MKSLPVLNTAQRDQDISAIEQNLATKFNRPFLYVSHMISQNNQGQPALFVYITDLDRMDEKIPYDLFFAAYEQLTASYQTQIDLYVKATEGTHWKIPSIRQA